jgi:hypothetical protein
MGRANPRRSPGGHRAAARLPARICSAQQAINEVRNAELKELATRTEAHIDVKINVRPADYPGRNVASGDTITTISWVFDGGGLHGQLVLTTLCDYLRHVSGLVEEAERRLAA